MTDQTKCPHCGADLIARTLYRSVYQCGSRDLPDRFEQSTVCEVWQLRAKVAAQQELLKEAADALRVVHYVAEHSRPPQEMYWNFIKRTQLAKEVLTKLEEVLTKLEAIK